LDIRYAQDEDFEGWLELLGQVQESFPGLSIEDYKGILRQKMFKKEALAATEEGRVVGALMFSTKLREIEFLAVRPEARRLGVAKALIGRMLELFPSGSTVYVTTYREGDETGTAARGFYHNLGFKAGKLLTVFNYPCQELTLTVRK
jgi:ribosomal protein S18 acetylase RimI-like enzyme